MSDLFIPPCWPLPRSLWSTCFSRKSPKEQPQITFSPNLPLYPRPWRLLRRSLRFYFLSESICAYSSTPSRTASLMETKNTDDVSNVLHSFNIFFLPFWQVASATVNQEKSSRKINLRLLEWRQVSVFLPTIEACSYALCSILYTNTTADKSMCACLVLWRDFIHQRPARTRDWIHAHERQNFG